MPASIHIRAALALAVSLAAMPALGARTDWREMSVGRFHLMSTLSDERTREIARQLQAFETTVGGLLKSESRLPDVPTMIYILDHGDFRRYGAPPNAAGVFYERPFANVITIDGDQPFSEVRVAVFHEYTHFIQRYSTSQKLPPWFQEGYAVVFSSFELRDQQVIIGDLPFGTGVDLGRWIPIDRVLNVKQSDPEYRAERLGPEF
jgi:hypothetical protein